MVSREIHKFFRAKIYAKPWQTIAKTHSSSKDTNLTSGDFRNWCTAKNIPHDGPKVERQFETFCKGMSL